MTVRRITGALLLIGVALTGCAQSFDATDLGVPATLASAAGNAPTGQPFKVGAHSVHAFWGLMTLKQARLDRALAGQLVGGTAVANVKITTRTKFWDIFVTVITAGIIAPRSVTYEGIVVGR